MNSWLPRAAALSALVSLAACVAVAEPVELEGASASEASAPLILPDALTRGELPVLPVLPVTAPEPEAMEHMR